MPQTPFHAYYKARLLEQLPEAEQFLPVFASSDIEIYPFQIAAASFALRSPYQKGAVLCDEAGMGKSHEAMLVINQKWLEGYSRILLVIPNVDLLHQWTEMLERFYTVPYVVLTNRDQWRQNTSEDNSNAFIQDAIVITTYDFAADNEEAAKVVNWDLTVFEEANALSPVYQEDNKQAKALKRIAGDSFKLLLTGTPHRKEHHGLVRSDLVHRQNAAAGRKRVSGPVSAPTGELPGTQRTGQPLLFPYSPFPGQTLRQGDGACTADRGIYSRQGRAAAV